MKIQQLIFSILTLIATFLPNTCYFCHKCDSSPTHSLVNGTYPVFISHLSMGQRQVLLMLGGHLTTSVPPFNRCWWTLFRGIFSVCTESNWLSQDFVCFARSKHTKSLLLSEYSHRFLSDCTTQGFLPVVGYQSWPFWDRTEEIKTFL